VDSVNLLLNEFPRYEGDCNAITNALTIDVEDWFHICGVNDYIKPTEWDKYESRVMMNTNKILDILRAKNTKATFFILGYVAERIPEIVEKIHAEGHEIGTHGYSHTPIYDHTQECFIDDLTRSISAIESITKEKVIGHRAASFSITTNTMWALNILADIGMKYDTSIFPVKHSRYGMPDTPRFPYIIDNLEGNGKIIEFPLSTMRIFNRNIGFCGGAYFRLFPYPVILWGIKTINQDGYPAIVYIHPWEIDYKQPRIQLPMKRKIIHYLNLRRTLPKLRRLLSDFKFNSVREVLSIGQ
jgi:polysaccharide deacetylase family protein (PEP-CTERM system associated)